MRKRAPRCSAHAHRKSCRKDRPLCRWRRREYAARKFSVAGPCRCDAFYYPHRPGSGDCVSRGGGGMPAVMRQQMDRHQYESAHPKARCPHCRAVHRDHSRCT